MFYGTFNHAIDAKGRTSLPARFREALAAAGEPKVFLIQAAGMKALRALPLSEWKKLEERVLKVSPFDQRGQKNILRYISSAQEIDLDEHGRVLVPAQLRSYAELQKDVVWTGMGRDMCLWDKARFEEQQAEEMAPDDAIDFFEGG
ncbi:MAG TPA: division/cell wall cluster transcriptional repressor MraZ [Anaeromyxobacteraceae bacterium]